MKQSSQPPIAPQYPHTHVAHGDKRSDPYYWLKNRNNPEGIAYLKAENQYAGAWLETLAPLQATIVDEMVSRIVAEDSSVPIRYGEYEYFSKDRQKDDYRSHWRQRVDHPETEELLLDENALAAGHEYFDLGHLAISPNHAMIGYATDLTGNEVYTIEVLKLADQMLLPNRIKNASGNFVWSQDCTCIYYTTLNNVHRPWRVYRHFIGQKPTDDELIFEEPDDAFYVSVCNSDSGRYIQIELNSKITSEVYLLDDFDGQSQPKQVLERVANVRYEIQDHEQALYILTNDNAVNFRLIRTSLDNPQRSN